MTRSKERLLVLLGPTAVGKTSISLELARRTGGEIISCDAVQIYRGLDIGSDKVDQQTREAIPHHLIDVVEPDQPFSVAEYQEQAQSVIQRLNRENRLPLLVGGSALYMRAVVQDFPFIDVPPDEALREQLETQAEQVGRPAMHQRLEQIDPESAASIHPNDLQRVIRALEVYEQTGKPLSQVKAETPEASPYDVLKVGLRRPREELYDRIDRRIDHQIESGFLEEVRNLLEAGVDPDGVAFQAIGYRQLADHLLGNSSFDEAVEQIRSKTRSLVRKQMTWFRREKHIEWIDLSSNSGVKPSAVKTILTFIAGRWPELSEDIKDI